MLKSDAGTCQSFMQLWFGLCCNNSSLTLCRRSTYKYFLNKFLLVTTGGLMATEVDSCRTNRPCSNSYMSQCPLVSM
jgi:hypothetical protein